jgi:hypothetical protein
MRMPDVFVWHHGNHLSRLPVAARIIVTLLIGFAFGYLVRRPVGRAGRAEVLIHWPLFVWLIILILAITIGLFAGHWLWP